MEGNLLEERAGEGERTEKKTWERVRERKSLESLLDATGAGSWDPAWPPEIPHQQTPTFATPSCSPSCSTSGSPTQATPGCSSSWCESSAPWTPDPWQSEIKSAGCDLCLYFQHTQTGALNPSTSSGLQEPLKSLRLLPSGFSPALLVPLPLPLSFPSFNLISVFLSISQLLSAELS